MSDTGILFSNMKYPSHECWMTFSYTRQENPTGGAVLDFSVWYCLSGTHFRCISFKLICRAIVREKSSITCCLTSTDLSQSRVVCCNIPLSANASTGICYNRPSSTAINRSRSNTGNRFYYSDPWPTVTSQPIRLSTNFMTLIPSLTFIELWGISMEHLQRVWHASRERLPFLTPGSVPLFGTCFCSNCWDQIPRSCHVFTRLFTLNIPWYFLDFASIPKEQLRCIIHV